MKRVGVPDDDLCREFHENVQEYVETVKGIANSYAIVISHIRQHNPAAMEDVNRVIAILGEPLRKEEELRRKIVATQRRMAAKYDLRLR